MALAYTPPGVTVEELYSPSVNPLLTSSASICLIGLAQGYQIGTAQLTFTPDGGAKTFTLPAGNAFVKVGTTQTFVSAKNLTDPTAGSLTTGGYAETTDFTTSVAAGGVSVTVTPVADSTLDNIGGVVNLVYRYLPEQYYVATRLFSIAQVEDRFGPAFNESGIVTPLTAAAQFAFENGAQSIVVAPLFKLTDPANSASTRLQPTAAEAATAAVWQSTLFGLRDIEDINLLVPVIGQSFTNVTDDALKAVLLSVQDHVYFMSTQGQPMMSLQGEDSSGSATVATATTIRSHAGQLRDRYDGKMAECTVLVSPSRFKRPLPTANATIVVGGQYMAAALAGMLSARAPSSPLTRRQVTGFSEVSDPRDRAAKDADAASGLCVIEQRGTAIQVRHSVTLDTSASSRREISVVRAKQRMMTSIRDTIDTQIIGKVPADGNASMTVKNAVIGVLEGLRMQAELVDYQGVSARQLATDPTVVEVRFSYLPSFPLNYVHVVFSIDLTGNTTTGTTTL
jgi:hypothetical protein